MSIYLYTRLNTVNIFEPSILFAIFIKCNVCVYLVPFAKQYSSLSFDSKHGKKELLPVMYPSNTFNVKHTRIRTRIYASRL